ncbi:hypothetical protein [Mycolicibacterium monacense]|uniref:Transmembrane protein n=4 Tax=Mycobacteriaceae TaxID=1762 RepID=A0AAD1IZZ8_MYCMB|nr:hypothetical protein [Mycolicibacterium monacense]MDA4100182.1 membrane protein [Mycolicibacterium monacense DSM 44395]OBB63551.1 hypothetical protein A6B34_24550 [Mycolicibacterium monacense]OBF57436.1 hypothetical protein A5778_05040 [Mycolicibacterium monacense]ORB22323.1 hypothetical protein BST34_06650 [Mycolicibacterium monacense DSM 44395]QHP84477.1 hypothetical protein EWR22_03335 [Mycolicibacterium monacense DSM 44395]
MRNEIVAGVGGFVIGHILWLIAITLATNTSDVSTWVLVVAALSFVVGAALGYLGWRRFQRKEHVWSSFVWGLAVSPVLFSIVVLGVTYL